MNAITLVSGFCKQCLMPSAIANTINRRQKVAEIRDFIEKNKMSVADGLSNVFSNADIVMVGEFHLPGLKLPREIASSLKRLKKEGLVHVSFEVDRNLRKSLSDLDFSLPKEELSKKIKSILPFWSYSGEDEILIEAKKLGLKVTFLDYREEWPCDFNTNVDYQNLRDREMFNLIEGEINPLLGKTLIFCGTHHVHKQPVTLHGFGPFYRLGMHLSDRFGSDRVKSIRFLYKESTFDDLSTSLGGVRVMGVLPYLKEVLILPDDGPIKGDGKYRASDYVVIDPTSNAGILNEYRELKRQNIDSLEKPDLPVSS